MKACCKTCAVVALIPVSLAGAPLAAQTPTQTEPELPRSVAEHVIAVYNHPSTVRLGGNARLPRGAELTGDVAVLGGTFTVAGTVRGNVVIINGDLRLEPGAHITGGATVVGGIILGLEEATVEGPVEAHRAALRFRRDEGRLTHAPPPSEPAISAGRQFGFGRTDLRLAVRGAYNRVEGLPIAAGARIELGRSNPTSFEALAIYRTESGLQLDPRDLGYEVRVEQFIGGHRTWRVGAALRSEVVPIETAGVTDRENTLATLFMHRDYRDYYEREGWSAYLRLAPRGEPYDVTLEYRDERHGSVSAGDTWALVKNDEEWRPHPIIARGVLRSAAITIRYDSRNEPLDPATGWLLTASAEDGLGGSLRSAVTLDPTTGQPRLEPQNVDARFTAALLDLRRYLRLGPGSRLALRLFAAGSVDGGPLPPQRQHVLGGEGSLPGSLPFAYDCGARRFALQLDGGRLNPPVRSYPYYGCDRVALFQAEYLGRLPVASAIGRVIGRDLSFLEPGYWSLFFNTGRAWIEPDARNGRTTGLDEFVSDVGFGFRLGQLGVYWARPLNDVGRPGMNFFVRIGPRL